MRRLVTAVLLGLFLIAGLGIGIDDTPARAQDGVVTFKFTNRARHTIFMRMFSETRRGHVWPGPNRHYIIDDRVQREARLACFVGEKVCFGGGYNFYDTSLNWGVGYRGLKGCRGCCLVCGTYDQNIFSSWDLVD